MGGCARALPSWLCIRIAPSRLPSLGGVHIVTGMRFFLSLLLCGAISAGILFSARPLQAAETVSLEDHKKLQGEMAQLQDAYTDLLKRFTQLNTEVERLRTAFREERDSNVTKGAHYATQEQIKELAASIEKVDKKRIANNNEIIETITRELRGIEAKIAAQPVTPPSRIRERPESTATKSNGNGSSTKETTKELLESTGEFYPHKVAVGESFSAIVSAYNSEFKKQGKKGVTMEQVRRANPKVNINRIYVGQEILIPAPEK